MATTSDFKLSSFLAYVANYLYVYRIKYNLTPEDNVPLKFLANSTPDTITINCCSVEPFVEVGDYWYNGSMLKKCLSSEPDAQYGFNRQYKNCYKYADAFTSTLLSLNPDIKLDSGGTTPPPPPPNIKTVYVNKNGDNMLGPLFLFRNPVENNEAVNKSYLDSEINKINVNFSKTNLKLTVVESNIVTLFNAIEALDPNSTKLNDLIARIVAAENSNLVFTQADQKHTDDINLLNTKITTLESNDLKVATTTTLGKIKVGNGLAVTSDGTLSVSNSITAKATTISSTAQKLTFDANNQQYYPILDQELVMFKAKVLGKNLTSTNEGCAFIFEGLITNTGAISFIGSPLKSSIAKSNQLWDASVLVDTANRGISFMVTGSLGSTMNWTASLELFSMT